MIKVRVRARIRDRIRVRVKVRIRVRFRVRLRSGCPDYSLPKLQSVILKFRTDAVSTLERVQRLKKTHISLYHEIKNGVLRRQCGNRMK